MAFKQLIARIHLWAGLILGLQVLLWMLSGVVMTWYHIDEVRGATRAASLPPPTFEVPAGLDLATLAGGEPVSEIRISTFLGEPVVRITDLSGDQRLLRPETGEPLIIDERAALAVARQDYVGDSGAAVATLLTDKAPQEYRRSLPVWQVKIGDRHGTRIYVSAEDGRIVGRRNNVWRLYDFFWMLHIMDYEEREDFNNPLVRAASATGLIFALSGIILVILRLRAGRYRLGSLLRRQ